MLRKKVGFGTIQTEVKKNSKGKMKISNVTEKTPCLK